MLVGLANRLNPSFTAFLSGVLSFPLGPGCSLSSDDDDDDDDDDVHNNGSCLVSLFSMS